MTGRALVLGLGVNNRPLLPFLLGEGLEVVAADRKPAEELQLGDALEASLHGLVCGPDYLAQALKQGPYDAVYVTPGMKKQDPALLGLAASGARITCETELFLERCPAPVLGITGSAGKTTTTTLTGRILEQDGRRPVWVGGNIGVPLLPALPHITRDSWVLLELSSFQLELVTRSPHGSAVLNIAENHLDIHGTMEAYVAAKARIFDFQTPADWLVLPDPIPPELETALGRHRGRRLSFSGLGPVERGAYVSEETFWWKPGGEALPILPRGDWRLPGRMNVENACAALAVALAAGASVEAAASALGTFEGVPHRLELVAEVRGVRYVNDSIATAPQRTLAALEALDGPLILILGGYDKQLDYRGLARAVSRRARSAVLVGEAADKIAAALPTGFPQVLAPTFDDAVLTAARLAQPGDSVVLSPAAASYDMFRNFEERGERFRTLVREVVGHGDGS